MKYPGRYIKIGETDKTVVKAIQKALQQENYDVDPADGVFDDALKATVKLFQSRNVDSQQRNLVVDGIVGSLTWEVLFRQPPAIVVAKAGSFTEAVLAVAASQVGVREIPQDSNRGPDVEKYLASVGLGPGYAWCAAFVYWCLREAGSQLNKPNRCLRSGGVIKQWNHAAGRLPTITSREARDNPALLKPGMVFVIDSGKGLGHEGFVLSVSGASFTTIEGNTDGSGSREGGGVYQRLRKVGEINKGYVDYTR